MSREIKADYQQLMMFPPLLVFKQSVRVAVHAGLLHLVLHAVDGTKIQVVSGRRGVWQRRDLEKALARLDASVAQVMTEVEAAQVQERGSYLLPEELQDQAVRRQRIQEALQMLATADRTWPMSAPNGLCCAPS